MNTKQLTAFAEGMMRETSTQAGEWVTVCRIALDEMAREALQAIKALQAAERERDEHAEAERSTAVKNVTLQDEIYGLKAELARRDAAVGEPVSWQYRYNDGKVGDWHTVDSESECNHHPFYERRPIYTTAQPAVLLQSDIDRIVPAIDHAGLDEAKHYIEHALYVDRERIRSELKELGAQQQKVVELPGYLSYAGVPAEYPSYAEEIAHQRGFEHGVKLCKEAIDAANVKREVKK